MRFFWQLCVVVLLLCPALTSRAGVQAATVPQRIVSLGPLITENIYLLGAQERLVGNTRYCVRPEAARDVEKIGSVMQVSIEKIISLRPDLVLAMGLTQPQQTKKLKDLGLRVVRFKQPTSFADLCEQFIRLGRILGVEDRAQEIVSRARQQVAAVQQRVTGLPLRKVFLQVGAQPLFGAVQTSFTHDFIVLAGGSNVLDDQQSGMTNFEKIISKNPDVLIIAVMGTESGVAVKEREQWLRFPVINAVKNDQVVLINPDLVCSPSPETFAATLALFADLIHPPARESQ